jgi:hypothetical protein
MEPIGFCFGLAIAAVIGILVAKDANARGMEGTAWGIGVFMLCIVFLPVYLIVRKPLPSQAPPSLPRTLPRTSRRTKYAVLNFAPHAGPLCLRRGNSVLGALPTLHELDSPNAFC